MKTTVGLIAASLLSLGLGGCVTDGYGYGSEYGYGAVPAYGYATDAYSYGRTCVHRERVWDPYLQQRVTVRRTVSC